MSARLNLLAVVSPRQVARRCVVYVSMQQVWSMLIFNATNAAPTNTRGSEGNLHTILSTTSFLHGCWLTRSSPCLLLCTLLPFSPSGILVYDFREATIVEVPPQHIPAWRDFNMKMCAGADLLPPYSPIMAMPNYPWLCIYLDDLHWAWLRSCGALVRRAHSNSSRTYCSPAGIFVASAVLASDGRQGRWTNAC